MERYININDYDYPLPDERIAKFPLSERDSSKLLIYRQGEIGERHFSDIAEDADITRKYCFEKTLEDGTHQIVEYRVTGDANDFSNWEIVARHDIGRLYK